MTENTSDAEQAVKLAAELLAIAVQLQTPQERRQQAELDRMINHSADKSTLVEMTDQAFRTHSPARVADQLTHLLDVQGIPRFFSPIDQAMLHGFRSFGEYLPGVAVPLVKEKMRRETANVILPAETDLLCEYLRERQKQGVRINLNLLGEAVLGEEETRRRMDRYVEAIRLEEVRCVSVKISTIYSQVSALARRHTVGVVADRLESLYRTADREIDPVTGKSKFIYLDMEEYRDLYLTADALCDTLDREGLQQTRAGIALQAYIPDSYLVLRRLIQWSKRRVQSGGEALTIRLVKGANMEMERVEASIGGYRQATYSTKRETDANYKRMLRELVDAASDCYARVGLASHNLFDVALGLVWGTRIADDDFFQIEMLEGMANHQRRALSQYYPNMLLYAPACRQSEFLNAIGYLIRRLDENTGEQNFLRHAYRLNPGSVEFQKFATDFKEALRYMDEVASAPRRDLDRHQAPLQPPAAEHWSELVNEPDTDWSVPANSAWAQSILDNWQTKCDDSAFQLSSNDLPDASAADDIPWRETTDPSRPGVVVCRYQPASLEQVHRAVAIADEDASGWRRSSPADRQQRLRDVAQNLRLRRGDLIGAMVAEAGKTVAEADPEVSEAIDFCEFYPLTALDWHSRNDIELTPRGVVAVISPWNFPLAIPCGGIAASLSAGNSVLLKPSSETVLVAAKLCDAFWDAGVPTDALQMLPCSGRIAEQGLVKNPKVDTVVLTGGTSTAKRMLAARPNLRLLAETGGKNATIVTAMADRDLAIKHVLQSAFGHSGQKCSATSLLLLETEVFHDEHFRNTLADAVESIRVGSAWKLDTKMGPLISPPGQDLTRGMKTLEDDETWLVVPEHVVDNPNLYKPGVKWNIRKGSFTHLTELFGPVLAVMPFSRLEEAIGIVRSTGYGLTSGLESLDDREIELWKQSIHAGNLYINRPTTGAIVLRQPFGGIGLSAYGPGVKAGGPHYVLALTHRENRQRGNVSNAKEISTDVVEDFNPCGRLGQWLKDMVKESLLDERTGGELQRVLKDGRDTFDSEFSLSHDSVRLVGQDNWRRYRPVQALTIRVSPNDAIRSALTSVILAVSVRAELTLSMDPSVVESTKDLLESTADVTPALIHPLEETDAELADRVASGNVARLRLLSSSDPNSPTVVACASAFVTIVDEPVLDSARIECLNYLDEQSISHDYHRYGNLGRRAGEKRRVL